MALLRFLRPLLATAALGLAVLATAPASAQMTPAQKTEIQGIIKDYLLSNPEVLRDAMVELDRREKVEAESARQKAVAELKPKIYESKNQAIVGNPNGKVTLVEFFDYNCGYCKKSLDDIANLIKENPDLRVVLKDFPVLGPGSVEAARVATAVRNQLTGAKFWEFHRKLLTARAPASKATALAAAKESGVDMDRLNKDIDRPDVHAAIEEVMQIADGLSLTGTPSFVLGDDVIVGAVGYDELKTRLGNVRKCGRSNCG